jgi:nicotinamide-nucleotide amidase
MIAELLSIGTELTTGVITDTNSSWLSRHLAELGMAVTRHVTLSDDRADIHRAIADAAARCELLIVTGGIGPTADDLTRFGLADALATTLEENAEALEQIRGFFARWGREMSAANRIQALLPRGSSPLENATGTAPVMVAPLGDCRIICLPGVPSEMKRMFDDHVAPALAALDARPVIVIRALHTFGAAEAEVAQRIEHLMRPGRNPAVGTTASDAVISVRIVARAEAGEAADVLADQDQAEVAGLLGDLVFGRAEETLATAVARLLIERRATVSTAESCTGGLLAKLLTDVPGSSAYFLRGYVTYANEAKIELVGVPAELIHEHGSVSEPVARVMAHGCRERSGSDFALSVTGVAGPTGGSAEKPVGLVYIGLADAAGVEVKRCLFGAHLSRESIRDRTCKTALNMLRLGEAEPIHIPASENCKSRAEK